VTAQRFLFSATRQDTVGQGGTTQLKEDVLEQIVDDYLQFQGYFTMHNVRFKPSSKHRDYIGDQDRVSSDVDVVGYRPGPSGPDRVIVSSCKSWQAGFNPRKGLAELREDGGPAKRKTWRAFRELWIPKWSEAFRAEVTRLTGETTFGYRIAVTRLRGEDVDLWKEEWGKDQTITTNLPGCSVGFLTLEEMWGTMLRELKRAPASSEIGRLAQLLKAAGLTAETVVATPEAPVAGSDAAIAEEMEAEQLNPPD
jgi:hypothetical protein